MEADPANVLIEIAVILVLIIANGVFAMSEIAIVSSRKARLDNLAEKGSMGAKTALELANSPMQMMSTVQVGITLIGIVTGAYGGATVSKPVGELLQAVFPALGHYNEYISFAVVVAVITYLSLIFGELVPKRIALNSPETAAVILAVPMSLFARACSPIVHFLSASTEMVIKALGIKKSEEPPVTEEEINFLIAEGTEYGTFENAEKDMVERVFRFGDMRVGALMTPRTKVEWLDLEDSEEYNLKQLISTSYSRLPVARGSLDELVGVVNVRDILAHRLKGERLDLEKHIVEYLTVPKSMRSIRLLELFQQSGNHLAVVMDEFGGMTGLITIHDLLEEIVGDISSQTDDDDKYVVMREDGSWLVDGLMPIADFKEYFEVEELPGAGDEHFQTLGGFIVSYLGDIPRITDIVVFGVLRLEVVDMDRARVDKVLVTKNNQVKEALN